jgi:hypothetical protein
MHKLTWQSSSSDTAHNLKRRIRINFGNYFKLRSEANKEKKLYTISIRRVDGPVNNYLVTLQSIMSEMGHFC